MSDNLDHIKDPLQQARKIFYMIDKNGNEKVNLWEIKQSIQFDDQKFSKEILRKVMTRFDQNQDGVLEKDEFCRFYVWLYKRVQEFKSYDTDGNHLMDFDEFYECVNQANLHYHMDRGLVKMMVNKTLNSQPGNKVGLNLESFINLRTTLFNLQNEFKKLSGGKNSAHLHYDEYLLHVAKALM